MTDSELHRVGKRIAYHRRRLGLQQADFAARVGRSESWVSQVERGVRSIDRLSVLQKVADALGISVAEIREGITADETLTEDRPQAIEELRLALSGHPALKEVLGHEPSEVGDLSTLRTTYEPVWTLVHEARYAELALILADLIPALERNIRLGRPEDQDIARRLLTDTYQAAAAMLAKISENDAAWIAADRAAIVAEQLSDPLLVATSLFRMAHVFISLRQLSQAQQVAQEATYALEPIVQDGHDSPPVEAISLLGAFHLVLAVVAARDNHRAKAQGHLKSAHEMAGTLGTDRNDFGTEFGPTNVALHAVSVAVDLGDAGTALDLAQDVEPSRLSPERQARFLVDVARAQVMRRQVGEAFRSLESAEEISPEQTHNLLAATEVVSDLIQLAGPHARPELRAMAERFEVTP